MRVIQKLRVGRGWVEGETVVTMGDKGEGTHLRFGYQTYHLCMYLITYSFFFCDRFALLLPSSLAALGEKPEAYHE